MVTLLVQHGASITALDSKNRTPIQLAASLGYRECAQAIEAAKATVTSTATIIKQAALPPTDTIRTDDPTVAPRPPLPMELDPGFDNSLPLIPSVSKHGDAMFKHHKPSPLSRLTQKKREEMEREVDQIFSL